MASVRLTRIEHRTTDDTLGVDTPSPRLTWVTTTDAAGWKQAAAEVEVDGESSGRIEGDASVLVPWPSTPLTSRERRTVRVRVWGIDGSESPWSEPVGVEAGLTDASDWEASWITPVRRDAPDRPAPATTVRTTFDLERVPVRARLHVTFAGIGRAEVNGTKAGDHLLEPGWTSYRQRLVVETHDVTSALQVGANELRATIADGWWRGHLGWERRRNTYGDRLGLLAQLEVTGEDGRTTVVAATGPSGWEAAGDGPVRSADLYDGETYDARAEPTTWEPVESFAPEVGALVSRLGPPIRRTGERAVADVLTSPTGRTILDLGQNLVGWVRFTVDGPAGTTVTLRHAEVLEHGELGTRPLRKAEATDRYTLRGVGPETWEPRFTTHGFRYVEVDGWPEPTVDPACFTAVVVHTDLPRTGTFQCSDELVERLHENVVWGLRGNVVGLPTDCPQRDERLGWTGDIQVFSPTASFLYDVNGFLAAWLADLAAEQADHDGMVPIVVPSLENPAFFWPAAAWGDAATVIPWVLYERFGDKGVLQRQLASMRAWVDVVAKVAGPSRLWRRGFQFADWLDPDAPPDAPSKAKTDPSLVATAYLARSAHLVSEAARVLGHDDVADEYAALAGEVREAFRREYVTPTGRVVSDSATAYALALQFGLLEDDEARRHAVVQLGRAAKKAEFHISTGFVGTPLVLPALTEGGDVDTAYRLLLERTCPSWLYPVTMGATTVWERWDSMLPDGSINPGEMTSFNHYALGAVADWLHRTVAGLAADEPGSRRLRIAPLPGGGLTSAAATLETPYGPASSSWFVEGSSLTLEVDVPPNTTAVVVPPGAEAAEVAAGRHRWTVPFTASAAP